MVERYRDVDGQRNDGLGWRGRRNKTPACDNELQSYGSDSAGRTGSNASDTKTSTAAMGMWEICQGKGDHESTTDEAGRIGCPNQTSYMVGIQEM